MATLDSKTILIFGGSSGLGYSVAEASLKSRAALVILASSSEQRVKDAVKRLESANLGAGKVRGEVVDAKNEDAIKSLLERIGDIDHVVFTSGDAPKSGPENENLNSLKTAFDVRFWGPFSAAKYAKIRPGGSITLTTGSIVVKPIKGWVIPSGVAGAIDSLTRSLAVDLAPLRVNSIAPGYVNTEFWDGTPPEARDGIFAAAAEKILVKHVASPAEIAEAYLFVMKCTYITGETIVVDGGYVLGA